MKNIQKAEIEKSLIENLNCQEIQINQKEENLKVSFINKIEETKKDFENENFKNILNCSDIPCPKEKEDSKLMEKTINQQNKDFKERHSEKCIQENSKNSISIDL